MTTVVAVAGILREIDDAFFAPLAYARVLAGD
jgi:hypothetical protein